MFRSLRHLIFGQQDPWPDHVPSDEVLGEFPQDPVETLFTGPRDLTGFIDYETALNDLLRGATTPVENAVVNLLDAFGPSPSGGTFPPAFFARLGVPTPPVEGDYLRTTTGFFQESDAVISQRIARRIRRPWVAAEAPGFEAWLEVNATPVAVAVEASRRPSWYLPIVTPDGGRGVFRSDVWTVPALTRELALLLCLRATRSTPDRDPEAAWADLFASFRLARLMSRGGTLFELLVGLAVEAVTSNAFLGLLWHHVRRCRKSSR